MMCLLKLQGSDKRIRSTFVGFSKEKRIRWSPMLFILNPDLDLHRGVKVLAMASMLRGLLVRNLVTMPCSLMACSLFKWNPWPSFSERERELQCFVKSSILLGGRKHTKKYTGCFPEPRRKGTTNLAITVLSQGTNTPSKEGTKVPRTVRSFQREDFSQTRATSCWSIGSLCDSV